MSETPELDRLMERLFPSGAGEREWNPRVVNFRPFWGPKAHLMTAEQLAAEINRAFDQAGEPVEDVDNYEAPNAR